MKKRVLGILLSFALMLTMMPVLGLSLTAYADDDPPYAQYKNTTTVITFDGKYWYLIDYDASTVTLLAKDCVGESAYDSSGTFVEYSSNPTVKGVVDSWYNDNIKADAQTAVKGNAMFLLTKDQADAITNADVRKCSNASNGGWWLRSPGNDDYSAGFVYGVDGYVSGNGHAVKNTLGVRPALKLNLSKVVFDSTSKTFSIFKTYPLWVGGEQVTSANAGNIDGNNKASYDAENNILTLNGYNYEGAVGEKNAVIYAEENLIIETAGTNTVTSTEGGTRAIGVDGNLTLQGSGTLYATGGEYEGILALNVTINGGTVYATSNDVASAIGAPGTVTINGGAVSATKKAGIGINAGQGVMINGGTVTAAGGGTSSAGIYSSNNGVTITGGTVIATGTGDNSAGVEAAGNNKVTISSGEVTATGRYVAIKGKVKNLIAGTGWTDTEGTEGKTDISVSSEGQPLNYKKVQFPAQADKVTVTFDSAGGSAVASQTIAKGTKATKPADPTRSGYTFDGWYLGSTAFDFNSAIEANITLTAHWKKATPTAQSTITYDLNGGTLNGETGKVAVKVNNGTVITLPEPTRDGYTFDYWEGSKYNAGDKYTVNGDHTFKAVWKTGAGGNGKGGTKTGDENTLGAWIVLLMAALAGTTGMVFARKRK